MNLFKPKTPQILPIPSPQDVFQPVAPSVGVKPGTGAQTPSFLGSAMLPPQGGQGGKTLLGS